MMTNSRGQPDSLWGGPGQARNIATVFVKPARYSFGFMKQQDIFSICLVSKRVPIFIRVKNRITCISVKSSAWSAKFSKRAERGRPCRAFCCFLLKAKGTVLEHCQPSLILRVKSLRVLKKTRLISRELPTLRICR